MSAACRSSCPARHRLAYGSRRQRPSQKSCGCSTGTDDNWLVTRPASAVVRKILAARVPESMALSARTPGFERLMVKSAEQCTLADSGADEAIAAAESLVVSLLGAYREELGRLGLIEPRWIGPLLADSPPDCGFVGALRFTTYSTAQMDLLRSLSGRSTVCVAVTWEEGFVPTAANEARRGRAAEERGRSPSRRGAAVPVRAAAAGRRPVWGSEFSETDRTGRSRRGAGQRGGGRPGREAGRISRSGGSPGRAGRGAVSSARTTT